jgi:hypothetical protein
VFLVKFASALEATPLNRDVAVKVLPKDFKASLAQSTLPANAPQGMIAP